MPQLYLEQERSKKCQFLKPTPIIRSKLGSKPGLELTAVSHGHM